MDFAEQPPKPKAENIVPMINVVFLLLIFFLMTAQIVPAEPFEVTPPQTKGADVAPDAEILYVSAEGAIAFGDLRDEFALSAFANLEQGMIRADAHLPAEKLAQILSALGQLGTIQISLITVQP